MTGIPRTSKFLAEQLSGNEMTVVQRGERFYLRGAEFEGLDPDESAGGVEARATEIVSILNAAAKVSHGAE